MTKAATTPREIVDAAHAAVAEGLAIVKRVQTDLGVTAEDAGDDGPRMRAWQQRPAQATAPAVTALGAEVVERIADIVAWERDGRWITAAAALTRMREHFEDGVFLADESSWDAFAAVHIPLPASRVRELIGRMVQNGLLRCTRCSAKAASACACGAPYVGELRWAPPVEIAPVHAPVPAPVPALDRALAAIAAHPEKSNRAIAAEIGVAEPTVRRARQQMKVTGEHDAPDDAPVVRVGRDGRSYPSRSARQRGR